jgi:hypothetical protein
MLSNVGEVTCAKRASHEREQIVAKPEISKKARTAIFQLRVRFFSLGRFSTFRGWRNPF